MPANARTTIERLECMSLAERMEQPTHCQEHWTLLLEQLCAERTVLDVGAGTGYALPIVARRALSVVGIDPLPAATTVSSVSIEHIRDAAFEVVYALDVIEHVEDDVGFLNEMLRVARIAVFLSTPNYDYWKCQSPHHLREYTPDELVALIGKSEHLVWTSGANRIEEPIRPVQFAQQAVSNFGVFIRAASCAAHEWAPFAEAHVTGTDINWLSELSHLTRTSEEWAATARAIIADCSGPLQAAAKLLQWLDLPSAAVTSTASNQTLDVTSILRLKLRNPMQQAGLIAWAINNFVVGPAGPHVNHPK